MERMKTFLKYLIVFVILYVLFDFFTYRYLVNSYKNIKTYEIVSKSPEVKIEEAKSTAVNGYIKGTVKNTTGTKIDKTNIKIDLFNSRGNNLGTKYISLENFPSNEMREFNINFRATNISHFEVSFADEDVDEEITKQAEELTHEVNKWLPFVGLVTLFCMI